MTTKAAITLIESETVKGQYGMPQTMAVVDTTNGRLLITQGLGGMDSLVGGAIRWRHGLAAQLLPTDTIASLRDGEWNDCVSLMEAVLGGHDRTRPLLDWSGRHIESVATQAGL